MTDIMMSRREGQGLISSGHLVHKQEEISSTVQKDVMDLIFSKEIHSSNNFGKLRVILFYVYLEL